MNKYVYGLAPLNCLGTIRGWFANNSGDFVQKIPNLRFQIHPIGIDAEQPVNIGTVGIPTRIDCWLPVSPWSSFSPFAETVKLCLQYRVVSISTDISTDYNCVL